MQSFFAALEFAGGDEGSRIEMILEPAKEKYPEVRPRIISDNGPQFIARDFKEFIRISGMTQLRTSPFYPQIERQDRRLAWAAFDSNLRGYYNTVRLHSAIGYVTPQDMLAGRQAEIHAARDGKLEQPRRQRQLCRQ